MDCSREQEREQERERELEQEREQELEQERELEREREQERERELEQEREQELEQEQELELEQELERMNPSNPPAPDSERQPSEEAKQLAAELIRNRWVMPQISEQQLTAAIDQAISAYTELDDNERGDLQDQLVDTTRALEAAKAQIVELREAFSFYGPFKHSALSHAAPQAILAKTAESYASLAVIDRKRLAELEAGNQRLLNVARGCFDYSGGHREVKLEIFHHGIQTVINALEAAVKNDPNNTQVNALERMGVAAKSPPKGGEQT